MSRTFRNQFGPEFAVPPPLLSALSAGGWDDDSWGNDVCPKFTRGFETLWVDAADPAARELPRKRFTMTHGDDDLLAGESDSTADAVMWARSVKPFHVSYPVQCCPRLTPTDAAESLAHRLACPSFRALTVARMKGEILKDIQAGRVPPDVKDFSELHDHVDANYYGHGFELMGETTGDGPGPTETGALCSLLNAASDEVDAWLKAGGHRAAVGLPEPLPSPTVGGE